MAPLAEDVSVELVNGGRRHSAKRVSNWTCIAGYTPVVPQGMSREGRGGEWLTAVLHLFNT